MSALGRSLRAYLGSRRALGVKLVGAERRLTRFMEFMDRRGAVDITYPLALKWAMQPPAMRPPTAGDRGPRDCTTAAPIHRRGSYADAPAQGPLTAEVTFAL